MIGGVKMSIRFTETASFYCGLTCNHTHELQLLWILAHTNEVLLLKLIHDDIFYVLWGVTGDVSIFTVIPLPALQWSCVMLQNMPLSDHSLLLGWRWYTWRALWTSSVPKTRRPQLDDVAVIIAHEVIQHRFEEKQTVGDLIKRHRGENTVCIRWIWRVAWDKYSCPRKCLHSEGSIWCLHATHNDQYKTHKVTRLADLKKYSYQHASENKGLHKEQPCVLTFVLKIS